ncbi:MAG: hypothetical protein ACREN8_05140 [Candidatus Dormibacteraceae bacterium]
MSFLSSKTEKATNNMGWIEKALLGILAIFAGSAILPILAAKANAIVLQITNTVIFLAPKVAIAAGLIGAVVWISPWHRTHGGKMIGGGAGCAFAVGLIPILFNWLNGNSANVVMGLVGAVSTITQHMGG